MANSRDVAALVGPSMTAMVLSEMPCVQPHLYDTQIPPVVYLSGTLLFVGGLAIVRTHNRWTRDWTLLVTLSGWGGLVLGLVRMFAANGYHRAAGGASTPLFVALEALLAGLGLFLSYKAYRPERP